MSTDLCHLLLTQYSHLFPPHLFHVDQTSSSHSPNPFFPTIQLSISIYNPLHEFPIQFLSVHLYSSISPGAGALTSPPLSSFSLSSPSPSSISSCLAFSLPVFLLPRTSWEKPFETKRHFLPSPSVPLSFNPTQWDSPRDSDYNQVMLPLPCQLMWGA